MDKQLMNPEELLSGIVEANAKASTYAAARQQGEVRKCDSVNHPSHYNQYSIEVKDLIVEVSEYFPPKMVFAIGNVIKYVLRAPFKGSCLEDLEKAQFYLAGAIHIYKDLRDLRGGDEYKWQN